MERVLVSEFGFILGQVLTVDTASFAMTPNQCLTRLGCLTRASWPQFGSQNTVSEMTMFASEQGNEQTRNRKQ